MKKGDTLWNIAQRQHVSVSDLRRWNKIGRKGTIYPGQVLRLY
ncbi:MAG: LysM domain-containing protein [Candidatus Eisenbacteria bacterium]